MNRYNGARRTRRSAKANVAFARGLGCMPSQGASSMTYVTVKQIQQDIAGALDRVASGGERIVVRRNRKSLAALIPIEDLALLERMEDRFDNEEADKALAEMEATGQKPIPVADIKRKIGMR